MRAPSVADFPSIVHEFWQAFADERRHWEIVDITGAYVATDRKRFLSGDELMDPMTVEYVAETCATREQAAYFIGINCISAAMIKTGIIHADA